MGIITLFLVAIALSFDTFAVSVTTGLVISSIKFRQAVRVAFFLGFFQALMPIVGWFAGSQLTVYINSIDHWIAFALLAIIGLKMIYESLSKEEEKKVFNPLQTKYLITISLATSIDALIVGLSFAILEINIYWTILIIGSVTFIVAMLGMLFGKKVGGRLGKRMEIVGGSILILIGLKIMLEHLNVF